MGQYIGFHVDGDPEHPRKATPISTGTTQEEAFASAAQRMQTLPAHGQIEVQEREEMSIDDFAALTAALDTHFAKQTK